MEADVNHHPTNMLGIAVEGGPDTPYLALDVDVMDLNIYRAANQARDRGMALRPHAKTHKSVQIAKRQIDAGAVGLTLATIGEAEIFAEAGVKDIFLAYPLWPSPGRIARVRALSEQVALLLGVDSAQAASRWGQALADTKVNVLVEVDSGHHRSGIEPEDASQVAVAAREAGLGVSGVFTFPGHGYGADRQAAARDEASALAVARDNLSAAGFDAALISGGSTPTFACADAQILNEIRPGVYVFNDAQQVELGTVGFTNIALTAHTTVVSRRGRNIILDAGSKVLGADRAPWVTGGGRLPEAPDARVVALSEHHATVEFPPGAELPELGTLLRVAPNHVCIAVNLANEIVVVRQTEGGYSVVDQWAVDARGANA